MGAQPSQIDPDGIVSHGKPANHWFFIHGIYKKNTISSPGAIMREIKALLPQHLKDKLPGFVLEGDQVKVFTDDADTARLACQRLDNRIICGNIVTTSGPESNESPDPLVVKTQQAILDSIERKNAKQKEGRRTPDVRVPVASATTSKTVAATLATTLATTVPDTRTIGQGGVPTYGFRSVTRPENNKVEMRATYQTSFQCNKVNEKMVEKVHLEKRKVPVEHKDVVVSSQTGAYSIDEAKEYTSVFRKTEKAQLPYVNRAIPSANIDNTLHNVVKKVEGVQTTRLPSEDQEKIPKNFVSSGKEGMYVCRPPQVQTTRLPSENGEKRPKSSVFSAEEDIDVRRPPPFHHSKSMNDVHFDERKNVEPRPKLYPRLSEGSAVPFVPASLKCDEPIVSSSNCAQSVPSVDHSLTDSHSESEMLEDLQSYEEDHIDPEPLMSQAAQQRVNTWLSNQDNQGRSVLQDRVWVSLLASSVNRTQLRHVFASHCEGVKGAYIYKQRKGCGVVILSTVEQAAECATKMNNSDVFGQPIRVYQVRIRKDREQNKPPRQRLRQRKQRAVPQKQVPQESCDKQSVASDVASNVSKKSGQTASESSRKTQFPVIVNWLPDAVTGNQLRKVFAANCPGVKIAFIYKSRNGCGEVVFSTAEQMKACVEQMNNTTQFGRKIRVRTKYREVKASDEEKSDTDESAKYSRSASTSVAGSMAQENDTSDDNDSVVTCSSTKSGHVQSTEPKRVNKMAVANGLSYQLTTEEFEQQVKSLCEGVKRAYIHRSRKGCGEIVFNSPKLMDAGVEKLNGTILAGRHICVRPRNLTKEQEDDLREKQSLYKKNVEDKVPSVTPMVIVRGLPKTLPSDQLSDCFNARCTGVSSIDHNGEDGTAEIAFATAEEAQKCVETMNGKKCFGAVLSVCVKESPNDTGDQGKARYNRRSRGRGGRRRGGRGRGGSTTESNKESSKVDVEKGSSSSDSSSLMEEPYLGTSSTVKMVNTTTHHAKPSHGQTTKTPGETKVKAPKEAGKKGSRQAKHSASKPVEGNKVVVKNVPQTSISHFTLFVSNACKDANIVSIKQDKGLFFLEMANNKECKDLCEKIDGKTYDGQKIQAELMQ